MLKLKGESKFFKTGNSFGLRLTKNDKEILQANPGDEFEKTISPDGQTITFRKKQQISSKTKDMIKQLFNDNQELMERLKDEWSIWADIIAVNQYVLEGVGQSYQGIQYPEGLSLVVEQPQMVVFGNTLYPTIWLKAAYTMQKITKKYIFVDGNKRTAFLTTLLFLKKNGYDTKFTTDEGEALVMQITFADDTEDEMLEMSEVLKQHSTPINK